LLHSVCLWVPPIVLTSLGTWAYSLDVKWPGHETDLLPLSRAAAKNVWNYVPTPPYITLVQCIIRKRNDLTSYMGIIPGIVSGSDAVSVVWPVLQN
jgi:hypothetical protein